MAKKVLAIRADEDEISRWKVLADGMSLSEWVRMRCNKLTLIEREEKAKADHRAGLTRPLDCGSGGTTSNVRAHHPSCRCQMCCK